MKKSASRAGNLLELAVNYLAAAMLVFYILKRTTKRWDYVIHHYVGDQLFSLLLVVISAAFFYVHRVIIVNFLKHDKVKFALIIVILGFAMYHKVSFIEIAILAYALFAILFIRTYNLPYISVILDNESRTPALFALLCIVSLPILLILKKNAVAEQLAVYAYYFLVITVVLRILEMKLNIDRENKLLLFLKDGAVYSTKAVKRISEFLVAVVKEGAVRGLKAVRCISVVSAVVVKDGIVRSLNAVKCIFGFSATVMKNGAVNGFNAAKHICGVSADIILNLVRRRLIIESLIFILLVILIVVIQAVTWKKLIRKVDSSPEYQYAITMLDHDDGKVSFAPKVDEITVPLRIAHPLSNPRVWSTTGPNPVTVGILWFEKGSSHAYPDALFEDRFILDESIYLNESRDVQLRLRRPLLPGGRSYDVQIDLVHEGIRWFSRDGDPPVMLNVELQSSRGVLPLTRELQVREQTLSKLADAWSDSLSIAPYNYRSKIELLGKADSLDLSRIKISMMNRGKLPWPSRGNNPVRIGVLWIQKVKENNKLVYRRIGEEHFPLTGALFPGKREIAELSFDPFKHPDADEIWVAMVHEGHYWFHDAGDDVLKLMDKRSMPARELVRIQSESVSALRETQHLKKEKRELLDKINDNSIPDEEKYRSQINLKDKTVSNTLELVEGDVLDIDLSVTNKGSVAWPTGTEKPVNIGILWFGKGSDTYSYSQRMAEERCYLPFLLKGGTASMVHCKLSPKLVPGQYEVRIGLVHEGVAWFSDKGDKVLKLDVEIRQ